MPSVLIAPPPLRCRSWVGPGRSWVERVETSVAGRVDDQHLRCPYDAVAEAVARLGHHLGGGHLHVGILPDVAQRLVELRVERVARRAEPDQPGLSDDALELVGHRLEARVEIAVLAGPVDR